MKKLFRYFLVSTISILALGCFQINILSFENSIQEKIIVQGSLVEGEVDTTSPIITIEPYSLEYTDQPITVYASTNEGTLNATSYTFTENGSFEFIATDLAGNSSKEIVTISNIIKKLEAAQNFRILSVNYNQIELEWSSVVGADSYDVYQGTSSTTLNKIANVSTTLFKTGSLNFNQLFYFKVMPISNTIKETTSSPIISSRTSLRVPSEISLMLSSNNSSFLSWSSVDGAQGYEISFSKNSSTSYTVLRSVTTLNTSHTGLSLNTKYNYRVRAYRLIETTRIYSAYSTVRSITTAPLAPSLNVLSKDASTLSLSWNSVSNASGYEIYLDNSLFQTVDSNVLSTEITDLVMGQSYSIKIVTLNGDLRSSPSVSVNGVPIPSAPTNFRITSKNYNGFSLSWDSVLNSSSYEVWRSTSLTGTYTLIGSTSDVQYVDSKAQFNTTYFYKVRSIIDLTKGSYSNVMSGKTSLVSPNNVVVNLNTSTSSTLSWQAVEGAQGYEITFAKGTSNTFSLLRTVTSPSTSHTGLTLNTKYTYRIRAYRLVGTTRIYGDYSAIQSIMTPPVAPNLKVSSLDASTLVLSWNNIQNATGYEIYQDDVLINFVDSNVLTLNISNLNLGQTYHYKIIAVNGELKSNFSSSVLGVPVPAAPDELKILSFNYDGFSLSWNSVLDSTSYEVFRSTSLNGTYTLLGTVDQTQYLDSKALFNTTYFYKVRAIVNSIKGTYSNTISGKTGLLNPYNLQVKAESSLSSRITWDPVDGASGYEISYRKGNSTTYTVLKTQSGITPVIHSGLSVNTTYYYRVRAYRMVGTLRVYGAYSSLQSITTPPSAPILKVLSKDASTLIVSWNPVQNATAYEIYLNNILYETVDASILSKDISNLQLGNTYQIKIVTLNGELRSADSISVNGIPIPAAPDELKITSTNYNGFSLSWNSVMDSSGYEVWRSTSLTGTYTLQATVNQTQYIDTNALFNTIYYYKVRAIVNSIKGNYSNTVNSRTLLQQPHSINLLATSVSSSKISWLAVDGAQGYEIYFAKGTSTSFTLLRSVTTLSTNQTGLTLNSKYTYRVRAYRLSGTTRIYSAYSDNFVIDYNSTVVLPHLAGILGTSTSVEESKSKITNYLNLRKMGNIKFVVGDYKIGVGQVFSQTPDAITSTHIYDLITVYISNS